MDYNFFVDIKNHIYFSENSKIGTETDELDVDRFYNSFDSIFYGKENQYNLDDYSLASGASKLVVICKDYDKVLKIPYNGYYSLDEDSFSCECDDEEYIKNCNYNCYECEFARERDYEDRLEWENFTMAPTENGWDYCEAELDRYNQAKEDGFEQFLAKTEYFGETQYGYPLYLQEKIPNIGDSAPQNISKKSKDRAEELNKPEDAKYVWERKTHFSTDWIAAAIEFYGEEITEKFLNYAHEVGLDCDMHSNNYGYRADGSPVIIDFSGYDS